MLKIQAEEFAKDSVPYPISYLLLVQPLPPKGYFQLTRSSP